MLPKIFCTTRPDPFGYGWIYLLSDCWRLSGCRRGWEESLGWKRVNRGGAFIGFTWRSEEIFTPICRCLLGKPRRGTTWRIWGSGWRRWVRCRFINDLLWSQRGIFVWFNPFIMKHQCIRIPLEYYSSGAQVCVSRGQCNFRWSAFLVLIYYSVEFAILQNGMNTLPKLFPNSLYS